MNQYAPARPVALLEREHEVERVRAALRAAGQRAGAALVIEGAAGVGKSRLLEEARARASDLGLRVLAARATELEQGFPFGVVRQLFERPLLEADAGERDRWLAGAAALAADVLTGAATSASGAAPPGPSAGDPGYAWQHGLYWLASNLAADSPLALVIDDLQWCDALSARTLAFIVRRLEGQPLAVILATRPLDPTLTPEAAALAADPGAELLRPSALTEAAVSALIAARHVRRTRRTVRPRVPRRDGRQPVLRRRAARGTGGSWCRSHRGRGGRRRRDRATRRRQRGTAPSGATGAGSRRARPRAQRARRRRARGRRGESGRTRRRRPGAGDGGAGIRWRRGTRRHGPLHPPHPARGDLRRPVTRRTGATAPRGGGDSARARSALRPDRGAGHAHRAGGRPGGCGAAAGCRPRRARPRRRSRRGRAALPRPRGASR